MVYGLYWYLGFKTKGFIGYFRSWIPAAPWPILIILIPVEILKYVFVQPFTLGVRLFANMFAGHLLLSIFMVATWYLTSLSIGLLYAAGSLFMVFFVFLLELLVDLLQAFIFTTLTATYIADSLEHRPLSRARRRTTLNHSSVTARRQEPPDRPQRKNECQLRRYLASPDRSASTSAPSATASPPSARASASAWSSVTRSRPWPASPRRPAASAVHVDRLRADRGARAHRPHRPVHLQVQLTRYR